MEMLLKVLGISRVSIAKRAGVTRQAVHAGSKRITDVKKEMLEEARRDPEKVEIVREARSQLEAFLRGDRDLIRH